MAQTHTAGPRAPRAALRPRGLNHSPSSAAVPTDATALAVAAKIPNAGRKILPKRSAPHRRMQSLILALALTCTSAFVNKPAPAAPAVLKSDPVDDLPAPSGESRYDFKENFCLDLPGALAPMGQWDPAGFTATASPNDIRRYREAETQHGRVAMLAVVGFLVAESFHPLFGDVTGPAIDHLTQVRQEYPAFFEIGALGIGGLEVNRALKGWAFPDDREKVGLLNEDYYPGDVGFDPLGLKPSDPVEFREMATKELQNGRLAMLAAAGFIAQELVNHKPIIETLKLLILLDESEIDKTLGLALPSGDIPTIELELETKAADTFFK
eukprot:CAMPEP_0119260348 /NCGR_PEP_ID=MMETSP1329-20130426/777_1 /TAXON_ID=114041 /ORGANISM="Genus nov. species nov., Strain RCC1024" /LENGTH=324 /DNA_ID=CAMNT_0007259771 /DNA_START=175 /DNA_END=1150 /DNA_ORIENTATION=-